MLIGTFAANGYAAPWSVPTEGLAVTATHEQVLVPRESANDDHAILVAWSCADGDAVEAGQTICELEFSKAVVEITAPRSGFIFRLKDEAAEVPVGKPVALIADTAERPQLSATVARAPGSVKVSVKAQSLIDARGIDIGNFTGIPIVKEKHVLQWLQDNGEPDADDDEVELIPVSAQQRRAAAALMESTQQIPHSWLTCWMDANTVDATAQHLANQHDMMVSVSDVLVQSVAASARQFKKTNASWQEKQIACYSSVHVGFALNQANGDLLVPVIHDASEHDLETLVGRIRGLQKAAIRRKLTPQDLSGGTITVTSLIGTGMHQVSPILVPGQSTIVAIGDRCTAFGNPVYSLTIGFDHRILNGSEAAEFLSHVAERMQATDANDDSVRENANATETNDE